MGWYSSFSLVGMMGSHCLVANYLKNLYQRETEGCTENTTNFMVLCLSLLVGASVFASVPMIQGDGYKLTTGGFCYSDFTNKAQSSVILTVVLLFLIMAGLLWIRINRWGQYWYFVVVFFATWLLWVPATSYGIATGEEIPSPYMIIGAIVGHGNAIVNPLLYGIQLFRVLDYTGGSGKNESKELLDAEDPKIEISAHSNGQ
jgi:Na+/proline symporter